MLRLEYSDNLSLFIYHDVIGQIFLFKYSAGRRMTEKQMWMP